jgi:hypothetical protein
VRKNAIKISFIAWLVLLLFVFSCENKSEKEVTAEAAKHSEKPRIDDYSLCMDEVMRLDTVGYQSCCKANNAC